MYPLNTTKKTILLTMFCFTVVISMSNKFSLEPSYSQDIINNSPDNEVFNIAIAGDWGCTEDTEKTAENIRKKNPEVVIGSGDYSYTGSADCWFDIIKAFKSNMKIAMGDHEYSDTSGGAIGIINQYLKPLNLEKTYYSFDMNNVHFTIIDPFIDYNATSDQYQFIENDLKTASTNQKIDWIFVVESTPLYTSPSKHPANSTIRDIYHPLFDKYGVDLVFSSDNHNYQRTFPLKYNSEDDSSNNPIVSYSNQNNYYNTNEYNSEDDSSNNPIVSYSNQNNYYNTNEYNSEDDSSNNPIVSYSNQNNYYNTNEYNSEDDSSNNPIVSYSNQNNYYNTNEYNSEDDSSNNPIVSYSNQNNYYNTNEYNSEDDSSNNPIVSYSNQNNYYNTNEYNSEDDSSNNPIVSYSNQNNYYNTNDGVIYLIIGTAGRSLYDIEEQAPFVSKQYDEQFGFLNIDIYPNNVLRGTFYANEDDDEPQYYSVSTTNNNMIDRFIISNMKSHEQ